MNGNLDLSTPLPYIWGQTKCIATHPAGRSSSALESPSIDELLEDPESMWNNTSRPRRAKKDESSGSGFNQYMDFQSIISLSRDKKSRSNLI